MKGRWGERWSVDGGPTTEPPRSEGGSCEGVEWRADQNWGLAFPVVAKIYARGKGHERYGNSLLDRRPVVSPLSFSLSLCLSLSLSHSLALATSGRHHFTAVAVRFTDGFKQMIRWRQPRRKSTRANTDPPKSALTPERRGEMKTDTGLVDCCARCHRRRRRHYCPEYTTVVCACICVFRKEVVYYIYTYILERVVYGWYTTVVVVVGWRY